VYIVLLQTAESLLLLCALNTVCEKLHSIYSYRS